MRKVIIFAVSLLFAASVSADVISFGLNRALANSLYCQLNGCTMTGNLISPRVLAGGTAFFTASTTPLEAQNAAGNSTPTLALFDTTAFAAGVGGNIEFGGNIDATPTRALFGGIRSYKENATSADNAGATGFFIRPSGGAFSEAFTIGSTGIARPTSSIFRVSGSDFTSASSTALQTITGLSWTLPANVAASYPFHCEILYAQTVAAVSDSFGIQAASLAPTNIMAKGDVAISASATTYGNLPTLNTTTATAIVTFTPTAITTIWNARIAGLIENASGVANTINVMVSQSTAADLIVIKRGSFCAVGW